MTAPDFAEMFESTDLFDIFDFEDYGRPNDVISTMTGVIRELSNMRRFVSL